MEKKTEEIFNEGKRKEEDRERNENDLGLGGRKKMDLRQVKKMIKDGEGGIGNAEKKEGEAIINQLDSCISLQVFLDRIPISSIPALQNSHSGTFSLFSL